MVGATGWIIVYLVTGGAFTLDVAVRLWNKWKKMDEYQNGEINNKSKDLKKVLDDELVTEEEYKKQARAVIEGIVQKYAER